MGVAVIGLVIQQPSAALTRFCPTMVAMAMEMIICTPMVGVIPTAKPMAMPMATSRGGRLGGGGQRGGAGSGKGGTGGGSAKAAYTSGVNVPLVKVFAYSLGGLIAAVAAFAINAWQPAPLMRERLDSVTVRVGADLGTTGTIILGTLTGSIIKRQIAVGLLCFNVVADVIGFVFLHPLLAFISVTLGISDPLYALVAFHSLINLIGRFRLFYCIFRIFRLIFFYITVFRGIF